LRKKTPEKNLHHKVSARKGFAENITTRIWEEIPSEANPYIAKTSRCHGYEQLALMRNSSFVEVLYLMFRGELPTKQETELLEQLMIGLINPGPRHPATRAAMNAGIGKTDVEHILPISLSILSGAYLGAGEVEGAMRFLRKNAKKDPQQIVQTLFDESIQPVEGDWHIAPGFGTHYGSIDLVPNKMAEQLAMLKGAGKILKWGNQLAHILQDNHMGWLSTGLAAAVFSDLGFQPRYGAGLYQLLSAPGLLAHGIEQANKPITDMPYLSDESYVIEK